MPRNFTDREVNFASLQRGDHIYVPRNSSGHSNRSFGPSSNCLNSCGNYFHHAIYMGWREGKHMIADFGRTKDKHVVMAPIEDLVGGNIQNALMYRREYEEGECTSVEETLNLVYECITEHVTRWYNVVLNNCEHFCSEMKIRRRHSQQVEEAAIGVGAGAAVVLGAAGVAALGMILFKPRREN